MLVRNQSRVNLDMGDGQVVDLHRHLCAEFPLGSVCGAWRLRLSGKPLALQDAEDRARTITHRDGAGRALWLDLLDLVLSLVTRPGCC